MAVKYRGDGKYTALSTDTKPTATQIAANVIIEETDTHNQYINNGTAWVLYRAPSKTEIFSNKSISGATNTLANIPLNSLANVAIASPATGDVIQYNGANWVNGAGGAGGGVGGGFSAGGTIAKSGNGTSNIISIAHGLTPQPEIFFALPLNDAARGIISYSVDATNINIAYPIAPASGSSNLSYVWGAGYVNEAIGFTPTSITELLNKTMSGDDNTFTDISPNSLKDFVITAPTLDQVIKYNGTNWVNSTSPAGGGGGGGLAAGGSISLTGNATQKIFNIPHGLSSAPDLYFALPKSSFAQGSYTYSADATNIILTYAVAPPTGALDYVWAAGYAGAAESGFTPTSITTLTGKTIDQDLNTIPTKLGPSYVIYIAGSTYKCRDMEAGTTLSSSTTNPETVINAALSNALGKTVLIHEGVYPITAQLLINRPETRLYMDPRAIIKVPAGYTGNAILLENTGGTLSNCIIDGGRIEEATGQQNLFTGIRLKVASNRGMVGNRLSNTYIRHALNCVLFETDNTNSWINSNTVKDMYFDLFVNGLVFAYGNTLYGAGTGIGFNKNHFSNLVIQLPPTTPVALFGIKGVSGAGNVFEDCTVWDPVPGCKKMSISRLAEDTIVSGGYIMDRMYNNMTYFEDRGIRTKIVAEGQRGSRNASVIETPSIMQRGMMWGREPQGTGLLSVVTPIGTAGVSSGNYDRGLTVRYITAASALAKSGWKQTVFLTARGWNFYMRTKVAVGLFSTAANCRVWIGFASSSTDPSGDNHYNALSFIGIGFRATDTDWQIISNDGTGATVYTTMTGVTKDSTFRTFEILADDAGPGFTILHDEIQNRYYHTADIPAQQTLLYPIFAIETTNSDQRSMDCSDYEIQARRNY
jgi:hypothetical protein